MTFQAGGRGHSISPAPTADSAVGSRQATPPHRPPFLLLLSSWPTGSQAGPPPAARSDVCCGGSPAGQRTLRHRSDVLETVVLVNPCEDALLSEVPPTVLATHAGDALPRAPPPPAAGVICSCADPRQELERRRPQNLLRNDERNVAKSLTTAVSGPGSLSRSGGGREGALGR